MPRPRKNRLARPTLPPIVRGNRCRHKPSARPKGHRLSPESGLPPRRFFRGHRVFLRYLVPRPKRYPRLTRRLGRAGSCASRPPFLRRLACVRVRILLRPSFVAGPISPVVYLPACLKTASQTSPVHAVGKRSPGFGDVLGHAMEFRLKRNGEIPHAPPCTVDECQYQQSVLEWSCHLAFWIEPRLPSTLTARPNEGRTARKPQRRRPLARAAGARRRPPNDHIGRAVAKCMQRLFVQYLASTLVGTVHSPVQGWTVRTLKWSNGLRLFRLRRGVQPPGVTACHRRWAFGDPSATDWLRAPT